MRVFPALLAGLMGYTALSPIAEARSSVPVAVTPQASQVNIQVVETKLGLKAWFVATPEIPVIAASFTFKHAGDKADPKGKSGLVSFLTSILNEGVAEMNATAYKRYLLEKNIAIDISANPDHFTISFRTVKENAAEAFQIVKKILTQPKLDEDAQHRVKQQLLTGLAQSLHSENVVASDTFNQKIYDSHPYGVSLKTTLQELPHITPEDLKSFMKERLGRDQLIINIAGAIDPEQLIIMIDDMCQGLPEKTPPLLIDFKEIQGDGSISVVPMPIPQSAILFYQKGISRQDPDFYAAYILNKILGDGEFESRLWNEAREKKGLTYGIDSDLRWHTHSHYILGHTATKNQSVQEMIDIIRQEFQKIKTSPVTEQELNFVKERLIGGYPLGFSSTGQIVALMRNYQLDELDTDFINRRNELIRKVTLEDVQRIAQKLIDPDKLSFIIVGQPENLVPKGQEQ
jgi:zinc protease